ncbi:helix-turn-helix transcriptional regulator [Ochrobactrum sp. AP1BH01-1]|jgi:transcriptional regulator with XRE-family HTH domain|uniref:helix-turn-helix domain-containing protein n=1 Tax=Ochrobactrum sp. AP1BH01-1 TaxID=2823874 RepID=UPI000DDB3093|nr:helix-turn-helix transcriptional regulator [Ochrobactrum sp. AP1BH01-1]MBQ0710771.1 helix-turn-helix transcriptional regulator [Ochrobactrum sp. AP1BH01-1]
MTSTRSTTTTARSFGERLKTARKYFGLTQDELALKSGLSTITLSKLESGVNKPSYDAVLSLCNSLEIEPNYFFGWSDEMSEHTKSERRLKLRSLILHAEKLDDAWIDELISLSTLASSRQ